MIGVKKKTEFYGGNRNKMKFDLDFWLYIVILMLDEMRREVLMRTANDYHEHGYTGRGI